MAMTDPADSPSRHPSIVDAAGVAPLSRRGFLGAAGGVALGASALAAGRAEAAETGAPVGQPPRRFGAEADPILLPDPDVVALDPAFGSLTVGSAVIERVWTGGEWLEGPAWSAMGRYLVFSDVRRSRQHRHLWEDGAVTVFRADSYNSNGNAFDFGGRQLVCEHFNRRVVRFEHDGTRRVLADAFEGRSLNSPNDVVPHPDGSVWFTDPTYGTNLAEGRPDEPGGPTNPLGRLNPRVGIETTLPPAGTPRAGPGLYRWDSCGRVAQVLGETELGMPNGLAFSPDHRTLYVTSTGQGPGEPPPRAGDGAIHAFTVEGDRLASGRRLFDMVVEGVRCGPDGLKVDVFGNLWCAASGPAGYAGVVVLEPGGRPIGRIRLPEVCANVSFGGPRRNILFMTATRSLYRLQVNVQGAAPS
ncbi:SMP-30/gluconolactonase/LRE family protein [Methylobacterium iners]|uniref:Gluconolactonase n=1 Tax=Methylobacterium iners TaxID=418707 RepID=A0ABQ4S4G3_9HYPH|nr:SMP-30/gluconolactonase/LRE family protein [Methylobacterium iners]GJD96693.1 Gluconolactonase [Methylobacterium iners]